MRNYGGAFDIDPEEYWTRDDLNELRAAIEELNPDFAITSLYLKDNDVIDLTYEDSERNEWSLEQEIRIDHRKAGTTRKLCDVYAQVIVDAIDEELSKHQEEMELV